MMHLLDTSLWIVYNEDNGFSVVKAYDEQEAEILGDGIVLGLKTDVEKEMSAYFKEHS